MKPPYRFLWGYGPDGYEVVARGPARRTDVESACREESRAFDPPSRGEVVVVTPMDREGFRGWLAFRSRVTHPPGGGRSYRESAFLFIEGASYVGHRALGAALPPFEARGELPPIAVEAGPPHEGVERMAPAAIAETWLLLTHRKSVRFVGARHALDFAFWAASLLPPALGRQVTVADGFSPDGEWACRLSYARGKEASSDGHPVTLHADPAGGLAPATPDPWWDRIVEAIRASPAPSSLDEYADAPAFCRELSRWAADAVLTAWAVEAAAGPARAPAVLACRELFGAAEPEDREHWLGAVERAGKTRRATERLLALIDEPPHPIELEPQLFPPIIVGRVLDLCAAWGFQEALDEGRAELVDAAGRLRSRQLVLLARFLEGVATDAPELTRGALETTDHPLAPASTFGRFAAGFFGTTRLSDAILDVARFETAPSWAGAWPPSMRALIAIDHGGDARRAAMDRSDDKAARLRGLWVRMASAVRERPSRELVEPLQRAVVRAR